MSKELFKGNVRRNGSHSLIVFFIFLTIVGGVLWFVAWIIDGGDSNSKFHYLFNIGLVATPSGVLLAILTGRLSKGNIRICENEGQKEVVIKDRKESLTIKGPWETLYHLEESHSIKYGDSYVFRLYIIVKNDVKLVLIKDFLGDMSLSDWRKKCQENLSYGPIETSIDVPKYHIDELAEVSQLL